MTGDVYMWLTAEGVGNSTCAVSLSWSGYSVPMTVSMHFADGTQYYRTGVIPTPGMAVTVSATCGGMSGYLVSTVPGGYILDPTGAILKWNYPGNYQTITVKKSGATTNTYSTNVSSPVTQAVIPVATAYPDPGTYILSGHINKDFTPVNMTASASWVTQDSAQTITK
jgi:hypothetical protein